MNDQPATTNRTINRRNVAKGMAWSVPALAVSVPAPAAAASLRKDPGINGWVLNSPRSRGLCSYDLTVSSRETQSTPDGAPFGLYIYDVEDPNTFSDARMVYWIIGNQNATVSALNGHSNCWQYAGRGAPQAKADGLTYTPYTFNYTCPITSTDRVLDSDGVERLYLEHFRVQFSFTQPWDHCNDVTYWTQRFITIDRDGPTGPEAPEVHTFERRNGTRGTHSGGARLMQSVPEGAEFAEATLPS